MRLRYCLFSILIIVLTGYIVPVAAQDLCTVLVQEAFEEVNTNCSDIANQNACYGHDRLTATSEADAVLAAFSRPSDFVEVSQLHTIHTQPLDLEEDEWGVAYFQIQPGDLADETIRVFMVGDVMLENVDSDELMPMQAFNFSTGGDSACQEAPNSVIVQGPAESEVDILVNGAPVRIGSTVVFGTNTDELGNEIMWVTAVAGESTLWYGTPGELSVNQGHITTGPLADVSPNSFSPPVPITNEGEGFWGWGQYSFITEIPPTLMNYPVPTLCSLSPGADLGALDLWGHLGAGRNRTVIAMLDIDTTYITDGKSVVEDEVWYQIWTEDYGELWVSGGDMANNCDNVAETLSPEMIIPPTATPEPVQQQTEWGTGSDTEESSDTGTDYTEGMGGSGQHYAEETDEPYEPEGTQEP